MSWKETYKKHLPKPLGNSYSKIAEATGKSSGTIRQVFSGGIDTRISSETEELIKEKALELIQEDVREKSQLLKEELPKAA